MKTPYLTIQEQIAKLKSNLPKNVILYDNETIMSLNPKVIIENNTQCSNNASTAQTQNTNKSNKKQTVIYDEASGKCFETEKDYKEHLTTFLQHKQDDIIDMFVFFEIADAILQFNSCFDFDIRHKIKNELFNNLVDTIIKQQDFCIKTSENLKPVYSSDLDKLKSQLTEQLESIKTEKDRQLYYDFFDNLAFLITKYDLIYRRLVTVLQLVEKSLSLYLTYISLLNNNSLHCKLYEYCYNLIKHNGELLNQTRIWCYSSILELENILADYCENTVVDPSEEKRFSRLIVELSQIRDSADVLTEQLYYKFTDEANKLGISIDVSDGSVDCLLIPLEIQ